MKNKTKIVIGSLTVIGVASVTKMAMGIKNKLAYEKKKLELEGLLHRNIRGKKDLRSFVKNIDADDLDAMINILRYIDVE